MRYIRRIIIAGTLAAFYLLFSSGCHGPYGQPMWHGTTELHGVLQATGTEKSFESAFQTDAANNPSKYRPLEDRVNPK